MILEAEAPAHRSGIDRLHRAAFGGDFEADLVVRLRADGLVALSLVAVEDEAVVGHILFSRLDVEVDGRPVDAAALAPLAVLPGRQRQGIGSRLVRAGLAGLRDSPHNRWAAAIVLGHPDFYRRFGFSADAARHLDSPYAGEAFMALEIEPGALAGRRGRVRYPAAFGP